MPSKTPTKPFGHWPSPITSEIVVKDSLQLDEIQTFGQDVYWIEKRPLEKGRCVIVKTSADSTAINNTTDLLPDDYSARSRVHEYGGGCYTITELGVFFVNEKDQQIYLLDSHNNVSQLTYLDHHRFADIEFDEKHHCLICVCENHSTSSTEPHNSIVSIDISNGKLTTLCEGYNFYSNPRLTKSATSNSKQLCWLCWNHPNMPWDGTELWLADYSLHKITHSIQVAGSNTISICQPLWSPENTLTYISDETGWWNLYQFKDKKNVCLCSKKVEFGDPQWVFGQSSYQFIDADTIICRYTENAIDYLAELSLSHNTLSIINTAYTSLSSVQTSNNAVWFISASSTCPPQITTYTDGKSTAIKSSYDTSIDTSYLSVGKNIQFKTRHNDTAYAIYYPPKNDDISLVKLTGKPPLIVLSHGGPTARSNNAFDIKKQFWTSRGFAILDVNYSGSTGYGRQYRERLKYNWGIRDVEDCCDAALYAVDSGIADPTKLIIKGSSAGGYSVLCALTFHDVFSFGASYYGIGELESLATDTHKFESHYLDQLIGDYPANKATYQDRSPINHVDQLNCPVIFFQGTEDYVVPQAQAEKMFAALKAKGLPVAYVLFEGEGHGFRQSATIESALNNEYYFYARLFNFDIDALENPVEISNLE